MVYKKLKKKETMTSIQMKNATITGIEKVCRITGKKFSSYLGLPYATPPLGDLRFLAPQKAEELEGEFNATEDPDMCVQMNLTRTGTTGNEDCLYANIHVPKDEEDTGSKQLKPVVIFVHGGIFTSLSGTTKHASPDYLVNYDVLVVTFNYRINILGFLNLNMPECPGNAGLKDIVMAFEWVKEHISYFGGDPNNITACGDSVGALAVHLMTMSPLSKDKKLFKQILLFGGNISTSELMLADNPEEHGIGLARKLGYRGKNKQLLLKFLKNVPAGELTEGGRAHTKILQMENSGKIFLFPFSLSVESVKEGAFLPEHPKELAKNAAKVPIMFGMVSKEGLLAFNLDPFVLNYIREDFPSFIRKQINIKDRILPEVSDKIKLFYFGSKEIGPNSLNEIVDMYTDIMILRHLYNNVFETMKDSSGKYPVYLFLFNYEGALNCYKKYYPVFAKLLEGPAHSDMLGYMLPFKAELASKFSSRRDRKVIDILCKVVTNYIKTGNPNDPNANVKWEPSTESKPRYLIIDDYLKTQEGKIFSKRAEFWNEIQDIIRKDNELPPDENDDLVNVTYIEPERPEVAMMKRFNFPNIKFNN